MKVAVIGSRGLSVPNIGEYLPEDTTEIVSGGAKGVDASAREYALSRAIRLIYRKGWQAFFIPISISSPSNLISGLLDFIFINIRYFSAVHFDYRFSHFRNIQIVRYHYNRKIITVF